VSSLRGKQAIGVSGRQASCCFGTSVLLPVQLPMQLPAPHMNKEGQRGRSVRLGGASLTALMGRVRIGKRAGMARLSVAHGGMGAASLGPMA